MIYTIYIILIDIIAFFFVGYGFYTLNKKNPSTFMWNKPVKNVKPEYIKQHNRGIALLYMFLGLCFFIVGIISTYFSFRLSTFALLFVIVAIIPTLSSIQVIFLNDKYKKN